MRPEANPQSRDRRGLHLAAYAASIGVLASIADASVHCTYLRRGDRRNACRPGGASDGCAVGMGRAAMFYRGYFVGPSIANWAHSAGIL